MAKLIGMLQICGYVNFSESTVLEWIRNYQFPACKLKGIWISEQSLVDAWWIEVIQGKIRRPSGVSTPKISKKPHLDLTTR